MTSVATEHMQRDLFRRRTASLKADHRRIAKKGSSSRVKLQTKLEKGGNVGKLGARERARDAKRGNCRAQPRDALVGSLGLDLGSGGSSLGGGGNLGGGGLSRLGDGSEDGGLLLGLEDGDSVGEGEGLASASLGVPALHDLDLDAENTLLHENVTNGLVNKVLDGLTGVDHETVGELHRLGTGSTQLTRDDDLATLGARLHNEAEDTVSGTADGKTTEELVAERLALGNGVETTVLDLLGVELERVVGELESLLDESSELTDAATLVTENLLGVGGTDDDLGAGVGDTDLTAGVSLLGELTSEELVELGGENTVSDKLVGLNGMEKRASRVRIRFSRSSFGTRLALGSDCCATRG